MIAGFLPMIGYHHVLMIIIALAVILLCKFRITPDATLHVCHWNVTNNDSALVGWVFLIVSTNARHLSYLDLL